MKRLKQILIIVNEEISNYNHHGLNSQNYINCNSLNEFILDQEDIIRMFKDVQDTIIGWKGVDIKSCEKQKSSFKLYSKTCLNWFNRNKAKIYGNHFFFPLIFIHILNVCQIIKFLSI